MVTSRRRLPPLNALRAFDAVARRGSLALAADELCVTHGAVSRQIAKLEAFFGSRLFDRQGQQMALTAQAAAYAERLRFLFDQMEQASLDNFGRAPPEQILRIAVLPTFAARILVPRLTRLRDRLPEVALDIDTFHTPPDPHAASFDVVIRWGHGDRRDVARRELFREELVPVCSPAFARRWRIERPDDLAHVPLLSVLHRPGDWEAWLRAANAPSVDPHHGVRIESSVLVYQGAVDGLGVALAATAYVHADIRDGSLIPIFDRRLLTGRSCYAISTLQKAKSPLVAGFMAWLAEETAGIGPD
ncbi:MAG TPA: LysR substrate-binding domain-containing protein [Roseomonas sp.]|jgi:LysR family glycine cleavage system transcriptional activator